jgi:hypothetical protein
LGGLGARRFFRDIVEGEERIAGTDAPAALDGEGAECSSLRGGDIDVFPLDIALHGGRGRPAAAGEQAASREPGEKAAEGR